VISLFEDAMEILLILWSMFLVLWSLYLFIATINFHKHYTALRSDQMRWLNRAERAQRDGQWKTNM
jgi:hypothetical protein